MKYLAQGAVRDPQGSEISYDIPTLQGLEWIVNNIVSVIIGFVGIVLFITLIMGGFTYLTAGGDPKKTEAAKKTLTPAIAGLAIILLSYLIMRIIEAITGVKVTLFQIYKR